MVAEDRNLIVRCNNQTSSDSGYIKHRLINRIRQVLLQSFTASELAQALLEVTDSEKLFNTILLSAEDNLYSRYRGGEKGDLKALSRAFAAEYNARWLERMAEIYVEHYSNSDLLELIFFYQSTLGEKLLGSMPSLAVKFAELSAEIGESLPTLIENFLAEHSAK